MTHFRDLRFDLRFEAKDLKFEPKDLRFDLRFETKDSNLLQKDWDLPLVIRFEICP